MKVLIYSEEPERLRRMIEFIPDESVFRLDPVTSKRAGASFVPRDIEIVLTDETQVLNGGARGVAKTLGAELVIASDRVDTSELVCDNIPGRLCSQGDVKYAILALSRLKKSRDMADKDQMRGIFVPEIFKKGALSHCYSKAVASRA